VETRLSFFLCAPGRVLLEKVFWKAFGRGALGSVERFPDVRRGEEPGASEEIRHFHERFMNGEKPKAEWGNDSDFEKAVLPE